MFMNPVNFEDLFRLSVEALVRNEDPVLSEHLLRAYLYTQKENSFYKTVEDRHQAFCEMYALELQRWGYTHTAEDVSPCAPDWPGGDDITVTPRDFVQMVARVLGNDARRLYEYSSNAAQPVKP